MGLPERAHPAWTPGTVINRVVIWQVEELTQLFLGPRKADFHLSRGGEEEAIKKLAHKVLACKTHLLGSTASASKISYFGEVSCMFRRF